MSGRRVNALGGANDTGGGKARPGARLGIESEKHGELRAEREGHNEKRRPKRNRRHPPHHGNAAQQEGCCRGRRGDLVMAGGLRRRPGAQDRLLLTEIRESTRGPVIPRGQ